MHPTDRETRLVRYSVDELIIVTDLESGELMGNILDFHQYGVGALLSKSLAINRKMQIRLTRKVKGQTQFIDMNVIVRWCKEKQFTKKYGVGFEIDKIDIKAKMRIGELINYYSLKS